MTRQPRMAAGRALLEATQEGHALHDRDWFADRILAIEAEASGQVAGLRAALVRSGRLIETSEDFLEGLVERANPGHDVTVEWGEPDAEGVYTPEFTVKKRPDLLVKETLIKVTRQLHGEGGDHRTGSWTYCPNHWCSSTREAIK